MNQTVSAPLLIRVLHVDDDVDFLKAAEECLKAQGNFEVDIADSVEEAERKLMKKTYDAIISDYIMPEKDGLTFLKELRERRNNIPFIIFTGKGREEVAIEALNLGADRYFNKLGSPEAVYGELAHALHQVVETRRAEKALVESEQKFRCLVEDAAAAIGIVDLSGKFTYGNKALADLLGYSIQEMINRPFKDFLHPEDRKKLVPMFLKIIVLRRPPRSIEFRAIRKDGFVLYLASKPTRFATNGKTLGFQAIITDITEQKQAKDALKDSEERLKLLFEYAPDAYYLNDLKGNFIDGNKAAEELTGYERSELIGKSFLKLNLLPRSQLPKAATLLARNAFRKPTGPDEFVLNRKDGGQVPVEIRTYPIKIKDQTLVLGIARDITERKKAEKVIKESQQKFERLFTGNPEAAVYLDTGFHILDANPRFIDLFGYSSDEIRSKHIDEVVVPKDNMEEAKTLNAKAKEGYVYHDTVRKRKDESLVHVSISAAPINVDDELIGYVGVYKDISQIKKTENTLKETMEKLKAINEKLNVVGKMTRHDARNKLSVITMNTFLAKQKLQDDNEAKKHVKEIELACEQIGRIFEFARTYEMLGAEELVYIDAEKAIREAAMLFSDLDSIKVQDTCQGLTVLADSLLRQLFYNLIDNSLRHGQKVNNLKVYYGKTENDMLKLIYEDNGVGIQDSERTNLFKEGYGKNTGYGLFLIRKICEVYGWTIQETGKQGRGAQFTIAIPKNNKNGKPNYQLTQPTQKPQWWAGQDSDLRPAPREGAVLTN